MLMSSFFVACSSSSKRTKASPSAKVEWLCGEWESINGGERFVESWKKNDNNNLTGTGKMEINGKTVFFEKLRVEMRGNDLYYIPVVKDQNAGKVVEFKLIKSDKKELIFENSAHDFPQQIIYRKIGTDSLCAIVQGKENGIFRKEEFRLKRVVKKMTF